MSDSFRIFALCFVKAIRIIFHLYSDCYSALMHSWFIIALSKNLHWNSTFCCFPEHSCKALTLYNTQIWLKYLIPTIQDGLYKSILLKIHYNNLLASKTTLFITQALINYSRGHPSTECKPTYKGTPLHALWDNYFILMWMSDGDEIERECEAIGREVGMVGVEKGWCGRMSYQIVVWVLLFYIFLSSITKNGFLLMLNVLDPEKLQHLIKNWLQQILYM